MSRTASFSVIVASILLGACAHQSGTSQARSSDNKAFESDRLQSQQERDETQGCEAMSPSAGRTGSGRDLAVTDCDVMALDRAAQQGRNGQLGGDPLTGNLPRLPTERRVGGL